MGTTVWAIQINVKTFLLIPVTTNCKLEMFAGKELLTALFRSPFFLSQCFSTLSCHLNLGLYLEPSIIYLLCRPTVYTDHTNAPIMLCIDSATVNSVSNLCDYILVGHLLICIQRTDYAN